MSTARFAAPVASGALALLVLLGPADPATAQSVTSTSLHVTGGSLFDGIGIGVAHARVSPGSYFQAGLFWSHGGFGIYSQSYRPWAYTPRFRWKTYQPYYHQYRHPPCGRAWGWPYRGGFDRYGRCEIHVSPWYHAPAYYYWPRVRHPRTFVYIIDPFRPPWKPYWVYDPRHVGPRYVGIRGPGLRWIGAGAPVARVAGGIGGPTYKEDPAGLRGRAAARTTRPSASVGAPARLAGAPARRAADQPGTARAGAERPSARAGAPSSSAGARTPSRRPGATSTSRPSSPTGVRAGPAATSRGTAARADAARDGQRRARPAGAAAERPARPSARAGPASARGGSPSARSGPPSVRGGSPSAMTSASRTPARATIAPPSRGAASSGRARRSAPSAAAGSGSRASGAATARMPSSRAPAASSAGPTRGAARTGPAGPARSSGAASRGGAAARGSPPAMGTSRSGRGAAPPVRRRAGGVGDR